MTLRRMVSVAAVLLLTASAGLSQNLAEAAKKEKERRASFKNKPTIVLTEDGLSKLNKQAAISSATPQAATGETETGMAPAAASSDQADTPEASSQAVPQVSVIQSAPAAGTNVDSSGGGKPADLEAQWLKAKEYADLLELKLNALWQEFYSLDDMTSRDKIQQEISATFEKYTRAREDEAKALAELEKQRGRRD